MIEIRDPVGHPTNEMLEAKLRTVVPQAMLAQRKSAEDEKLAAFLDRERQSLPIFYMRGVASKPGQAVDLHFFEPRYKILIRRTWEGNRRFLCTQTSPSNGDTGLLVQVEQASFLPDGRANIHGRGMERVILRNVWVEKGTEGLFYASLNDSLTKPVASVVPPAQVLRGAIREGAPAYNRGNIERCASIYTDAAERTLQQLEANCAMALRLQRGLEEARKAKQEGNVDEAAWALRHAFDAVLDMTSSQLNHSGTPRSSRNQLTAEASTLELPVFFMSHGGMRGDTVRLRFFEPRYRILAREAWESAERLFLYAESTPQVGSTASVVKIETCMWDAEGCANVVCRRVESARLTSARQDGTKEGLFYAFFSVSAATVRRPSNPKKKCCSIQ